MRCLIMRKPTITVTNESGHCKNKWRSTRCSVLLNNSSTCRNYTRAFTFQWATHNSVEQMTCKEMNNYAIFTSSDSKHQIILVQRSRLPVYKSHSEPKTTALNHGCPTPDMAGSITQQAATSANYVSSSSVICHTTGPQPLPKRFLHLMRSRASSFKLQYPLLSPRSSSNFLRLLPHLLVPCICPFIFPSKTCFRRQFLRMMWPI
jgi:hypothetical protein